jgi:hypothetical protein
MKLKVSILILALACLWSTSAQPVPNTLAVIEENETLSVLWNGSPLAGAIISPIPEAPSESWHVYLPPGYVLNPGAYTVGEPPGEPGINVITVDPVPAFIPPGDNINFNSLEIIAIPILSGFTWVSDLPGPAGLPSFLLVPGAGTFFPVILPVAVDPQFGPFDLWLEDRPDSAPDAGSTFALAGIAFAALGAFRSRIAK